MSDDLPLFGRLPAQAELQFAEFYRTCLTASLGNRVRAAEVRARYLRWAGERGCGSISFRELRRMLEWRGHRHLYSNGAWYLDISLSDGDHVSCQRDAVVDDATRLLNHAMALQKRREELDTARLRDLLKQVDSIASDLTRLRRSIVGALP